MWSQVIVIVTPCLDGFARLGEREEDVLVEASSRNLLLKLSMKAFCTGLPGSM